MVRADCRIARITKANERVQRLILLPRRLDAEYLEAEVDRGKLSRVCLRMLIWMVRSDQDRGESGGDDCAADDEARDVRQRAAAPPAAARDGSARVVALLEHPVARHVARGKLAETWQMCR